MELLAACMHASDFIILDQFLVQHQGKDSGLVVGQQWWSQKQSIGGQFAN
jgi:hypothetical protein